MALTPKSARPRSTLRALGVLIVVLAIVLFSIPSVGQSLLFLGALFGSGLLYESDWIYPRYVDRFRMTIAVEVDGKVMSGTSVNEIVWKPGPKWLEGLGSRGAPGIIGEALCVNLGKRGALVLTLEDRWESYGNTRDPKEILNYPITQIGIPQPFPDLPTSLPGQARSTSRFELSPSDLWMISIFPNPDSWEGSHPVDPKNLSEYLGHGAKIISVTVESTEDPITKNLPSCLPLFNKTDISHGSIFIRGISP